MQELQQILQAVSDSRDLEIDYADLAIDDTGIIDPENVADMIRNSAVLSGV